MQDLGSMMKYDRGLVSPCCWFTLSGDNFFHLWRGQSSVSLGTQNYDMAYTLERTTHRLGSFFGHFLYFCRAGKWRNKREQEM